MYVYYLVIYIGLVEWWICVHICLSVINFIIIMYLSVSVNQSSLKQKCPSVLSIPVQ